MRYIYVPSKADEMASLVSVQQRKNKEKLKVSIHTACRVMFDYRLTIHTAQK